MQQTRLRIAQVAPLWTPVPPAAYGGAELMVHWLTETLVTLGHDVTLFASADSTTSAKLVPLCEENLIDRMQKGEAYGYEYYALANMVAALQMSDQFDVIHNHLGATMIPLDVLATVPVVHTVHAGLDSPDEHWLLERFSDATVAGISHSQISTIKQTRRQTMPVIYHGCDLQQYRFSSTPGDYLAFIGRMSDYKNPLAAITVANLLEQNLILAGTPQTASEVAYFESTVVPLIDDKRIHYLGAINQERKIEFISNASVMLFPIQWEEHFGLVMIEAMACGTPVVALRRGSVPEVIDEGITGFFTDDVNALPELVLKAQQLDRQAVRRQAEKRFSLQRMASDYVDLYRARMQNGSAPSGNFWSQDSY